MSVSKPIAALVFFGAITAAIDAQSPKQSTEIPDATQLIKPGKDIYWVCDRLATLTSLGGQKVSEAIRVVRRVKVVRISNDKATVLYWSDASQVEPSVEFTNVSVSGDFTLGGDLIQHFPDGDQRRFLDLSQKSLDYSNTHETDNAWHAQVGPVGRTYTISDQPLRLAVLVHTSVKGINSTWDATAFFNDQAFKGTATIQNSDAHSLSEFIPGYFIAAKSPRSSKQTWGGAYKDERSQKLHYAFQDGYFYVDPSVAQYENLATFEGSPLVDGYHCAQISVKVKNSITIDKEPTTTQDSPTSFNIRMSDGLLQHVHFGSSGHYRVKGVLGDGSITEEFWRSDSMPTASKIFTLTNWAADPFYDYFKQ